ncbi:uncharacterized protein LOC130261563 [Oenanthe melanoleuca]|uniref:uncharacterized protein LOC130261563 n=1 Tax=Oenanthe melanoleuca TaxID=2939378 RepID=UPI0024C11DED|nr:uncharacterized protein LOC130261563 [Oenanthe melanoleuca]
MVSSGTREKSKNHGIVNCRCPRRLWNRFGAAGFGGSWWLEEEAESPGGTCALRERQLSFPRGAAPVERRDGGCRAALGLCPSGSSCRGLLAARAERAGEEKSVTRGGAGWSFSQRKGQRERWGCDGEHSPRPYPGSLTAIPPGFRLPPARSWAGVSEIPSPGAVPAAVNPSRGSRSCNTEGGEGKVSSEASPPQQHPNSSQHPGVRPFPALQQTLTLCFLPSGRWDVQGESIVIPRAAFSSEWRREPGSALFIRRSRITKVWVRSDSEFPTVSSQSMRARDKGKASITAWQIDCELPGDNTPLPKEQVGWGVWDTIGFGIAALGRERGKAFVVIIIQLLPDVGNVNISMCCFFPGWVEIKHRRLIPGRDNALSPKERLKRERCRIRGTKPFHRH